MISISIKRVSDNAKLPTRGSDKAAGWDLYANLMAPITLNPHTTIKVSTGVCMAIPDGYWGGIYARSGLATKLGLAPANQVGVIDSDYRGEIIVALHNYSNKVATINPNERIGQFILHKVYDIDFQEKEELDSTNRGANGFGSTGR